MSDRPWWETFRDQVPAAERWAYFDHAAMAPLLRDTHRAMVDWADDMLEYGVVHWNRWAAELETLRRRGAQLVGADLDEIALIRNTTEGLSLVAEGFPWREGDNVVTLSNEFPANQYPWLNLAARGVETRRVDAGEPQVDLDRLAAACDQRTRIIAMSWVGYTTGWRGDIGRLAQLAHDRGALLCLDVIQGLGAFPLDVRATGVDIFSAGGHKWLFGPEGAGLMFVRREHLDLLRPLGVGWNSVVGAHDFTRIVLDVKPSASRYEGGTYNMAGFAGLSASLKLLLDLGVENIAGRILEITALACERLASLDANIFSPRGEEARQSGIVTFELPGRDPSAARKHCLQRGVVLRSRAGRLRISPHAYNTASDVERLVESLAEVDAA